MEVLHDHIALLSWFANVLDLKDLVNPPSQKKINRKKKQVPCCFKKYVINSRELNVLHINKYVHRLHRTTVIKPQTHSVHSYFWENSTVLFGFDLTSSDTLFQRTGAVWILSPDNLRSLRDFSIEVGQRQFEAHKQFDKLSSSLFLNILTRRMC